MQTIRSFALAGFLSLTALLYQQPPSSQPTKEQDVTLVSTGPYCDEIPVSTTFDSSGLENRLTDLEQRVADLEKTCKSCQCCNTAKAPQKKIAEVPMVKSFAPPLAESSCPNGQCPNVSKRSASLLASPQPQVPVMGAMASSIVVTKNEPGHWTHPGTISNHLQRDHKVDPSGLTRQQQLDLHDAIHEGNVAYTQPQVSYQTSSCPGGVCPTSSAGRSTRIFPNLFPRLRR